MIMQVRTKLLIQENQCVKLLLTHYSYIFLLGNIVKSLLDKYTSFHLCFQLIIAVVVLIKERVHWLIFLMTTTLSNVSWKMSKKKNNVSWNCIWKKMEWLPPKPREDKHIHPLTPRLSIKFPVKLKSSLTWHLRHILDSRYLLIHV